MEGQFLFKIREVLKNDIKRLKASKTRGKKHHKNLEEFVSLLNATNYFLDKTGWLKTKGKEVLNVKLGKEYLEGLDEEELDERTYKRKLIAERTYINKRRKEIDKELTSISNKMGDLML